MSDALLSAALNGLESNQVGPALLWLIGHAASGKSGTAVAGDVSRRLAAIMAEQGEVSETIAPAASSWSDLAGRHLIPESLLLALNPAAAGAPPVEGSSVRVVRGEFKASISRQSRTLRLHWKSQLAGEFLVSGFDTTNIPDGPQEVRAKRIDPVFYDPKVARSPREPYGLRFNRHVLQLAGGVKIHGLPDWDSNTMGLGLAAGDAALCYAVLPIGSRIEVVTDNTPTGNVLPKNPETAGIRSTSALAEIGSHVALAHADCGSWKPVRVTAAGISSSLRGAGGFAVSGLEVAMAQTIDDCIHLCEIALTSSPSEEESAWTSNFTTAELAAISWPIEAGPNPASNQPGDNSFFPLDQQGAAWPPPSGWQLLQLGLTLTAVVLLAVFVMRWNPGEANVAKNKPVAAATRPGDPPQPIADTTANGSKGSGPSHSAKSNAPALLPAPDRPSAAATPPVASAMSPRVERAVFVEKPGSDGLPPIVAPDRTQRFTMDVLAPDGAVAVGSRAIYQIRLQNHTATPAQGIDVQAFFSEGFEPDAADGMPARHGPGRLVFDRIDTLAPGASITLRVAAKAQAPGSHRFRPEVNVAHPPQRLYSESTTQFYAPVSRNPGMNQQR